MADELDTGFFENEHEFGFIASGAINEDDEEILMVENEEEEAEAIENKKLKRKVKLENLKAKKLLKRSAMQQQEESINESNAIGLLVPTKQYDILKQSQPGNMTVLDSVDINQIVDVSAIEIKSCKFASCILYSIDKFKKRMNIESKESGSPLVVVVCSSAIRAVDIIRSLSSVLKCKIGKLFAKHLKLQQQIDSLKQYYPIVVGTPNRLSKLIELGALSMSRVELVMFDLEKDIKSFHLFTHPSVSTDVWELFQRIVALQYTSKFVLI